MGLKAEGTGKRERESSQATVSVFSFLCKAAISMT